MSRSSNLHLSPFWCKLVWMSLRRAGCPLLYLCECEVVAMCQWWSSGRVPWARSHLFSQWPPVLPRQNRGPSPDQDKQFIEILLSVRWIQNLLECNPLSVSMSSRKGLWFLFRVWQTATLCYFSFWHFDTLSRWSDDVRWQCWHFNLFCYSFDI